MRIHPEEDTDIILASWLTLKAQDHTYALIRDGIKMGQPGPELTPFAAELRWPHKASAGTYHVRAYECRDKDVVGVTQTELQVLEVGFPAWLSGMALNRTLLYGIICVVIAAIAGFGIDFLVTLLFGSKVSAH
jgi:hypothetical protein